jgi:hypothetical protein
MNITMHGITYQVQGYLHLFVLLVARMALDAMAAGKAA